MQGESYFEMKWWRKICSVIYSILFLNFMDKDLFLYSLPEKYINTNYMLVNNQI